MRTQLLAGSLVAVCALAGPSLATAATAEPSPTLTRPMVQPAYWAWRGGVRVWVRPTPYYYGGGYGGGYYPYYGSGYYPSPSYVYAPPPAVYYYPWPGYPPASGQGDYGGRG